MESMVLVSSSNPVTKCDVINSIIYGSAKGELAIGSSPNISYRFINCLIKGTEKTSTAFTNIIWNKDPMFVNIDKENNFSYNFGLLSGSPAIDKADRTYSASAPTDLRGKQRLNDSNPDIGCYEWIP